MMTTSTSKAPLLLSCLFALACLTVFVATVFPVLIGLVAATPLAAPGAEPVVGLPSLTADQVRSAEAAKIAESFVASRSISVVSNEELSPRSRRVAVLDHGKTCRVDLRYSGSFEQSAPSSDGIAPLPAGWQVSGLTCD